MKLPIESIAPVPCATCGSVYPIGDMTNCDECDASLCPYDARTITSEDVVCPACHDKYMREATDAGGGARAGAGT